MTRLLVALAIAILAPIMAMSLLRDARRSPEAVAPAAPQVKARNARALTAPGTADSVRVRDAVPSSALPRAEHPLSEALCFADMLLVDASTCPSPGRGCDEHDGGDGCRESAQDDPCPGSERRLAFCIDRFEYPNVPGTLPAMMLTFEMADSACRHEGKRLCTDEEWSLACHGSARAPAPAGQGAELACNVGPSAVRVPVEKLWNGKELPGLVEQFDARARSGARSACTSDFGVGDLLGNVSEWVRASADDPTSSALKGGDFTGAPATCAALRRIHAAHYVAFAAGTRCCADPLVTIPRKR